MQEEAVWSAGQVGISVEEFCALHAARIGRFAAFFAADPAAAEDLAQEALFRCIRALQRGQFQSNHPNLHGWIWRVVANAASDARRRERRARELWRRLASLGTAIESPEDVALASIGDDVLAKALRELSAGDRLLLGLRYAADLDVGEVGRATGRSPEAASRAIRRALQRLRSKLPEIEHG